jgi:hypothetical protein
LCNHVTVFLFCARLCAITSWNLTRSALRDAATAAGGFVMGWTALPNVTRAMLVQRRCKHRAKRLIDFHINLWNRFDGADRGLSFRPVGRVRAIEM